MTAPGTVKINAAEFVGLGFPADEGKKLAQGLLQQEPVIWDDLEIDVSRLRADLLISAFFNSFLQRIYDCDAALLPKAQSVRWVLRFGFQYENVGRWMTTFKPASAAMDECERLRAENDRLSKALVAAYTDIEVLKAERDRLLRRSVDGTEC